MNVRLASLLFLSITFSTPLCANDEVSSKFVKCAEIVLNGLVHCGEKIGTFAYEGLIRSPEITKGAATIVVSGAALYGTYKAAYVIPAFFKYVKDSLSNLAFFPGRVAETNENTKLSVKKLNDLEIQVGELGEQVGELGEKFDSCILGFARSIRFIAKEFQDVKQKQDSQHGIVKNIEKEVNTIRPEIINVERIAIEVTEGIQGLQNNIDGIESIAKNIEGEFNALRDKFSFVENNIIKIEGHTEGIGSRVEALQQKILDINSVIKETHSIVVDLHNLDLGKYIENVTQANEFLTVHVEEIHSATQNQEKIRTQENTSNNVLVQGIDINGRVSASVYDGKNKENMRAGGIFTHIITPKLVTMKKKIEESKGDLTRVEQELNVKIKESNTGINQQLSKIEGLLVQSLAAKDDEIKRAQDAAEKAKQELAMCLVFLNGLISGAHDKLVSDAESKGCTYVGRRPNDSQLYQDWHRTSLVDFTRSKSASGMHNSWLLVPNGNK